MTVTEEWQLERLRYALRIYHRTLKNQRAVAREAGDADLVIAGWPRVWYEIAYHAKERGITLPYSRKNGIDRIRKFVQGEGVRKGPSNQKPPTPKPVLLEAIIAFATDSEIEDIDLTLEDLESYDIDWGAPSRLSGYLRQKFEPAYAIDPLTVEGVFQVSNLIKDEADYQISGDELEIRQLTIYDSTDEGLFRVRERQEIYGEIEKDSLDKLSPAERKNKRFSHADYAGWAILTPELNLLYFLKEVRTGMNRYYLTLFSERSKGDMSDLRSMVLLHHDFPYQPYVPSKDEMDYSWRPRSPEDISEAISENLYFFRRQESEQNI